MDKNHLVIKDLTLLSIRERSGKKVTFHPERNVITGTNDVGKSSLIKSIYHTFGADVEFSTHWEPADVIGVVEFQFGAKSYKVLRAAGNFGLFDVNGKLIEAYDSIIKGIGPKLANLFDNKLKLQQINVKSRTPVPPAIQFMPFYIDQDASWSRAWSSFSGLGSFSGYKNDLIDFITGIKPNEYYKLSESIDAKSADLTEMRNELSVLDKAKRTIESQIPKKTYNIDINSYKKEIDRLLVELEALKSKEAEYRNRLIRFRSKDLFADSQIELAQKSIREIEKDYQYSISEIDGGEVSCPTCDTTFENSMISRFGLLEDVDSCRVLINDHLQDKKMIKKNIVKAEVSLNNQRARIKKIMSLMDEKKGRFKLKDIIDNECSKQVSEVFVKSRTKYSSDIYELEGSVEFEKKNRAKFLNKERKDEIVGSFLGVLDLYLIKLNVKSLSRDGVKGIPKTIKDQGSDMPRALLAYYYSILHTMRKYTRLPVFPFVIDSPNQQDQDPENRHKIIQYIFDTTPDDCQLILGTVDLHGVEYDGHVISPKNKYKLLRKDEYESCHDHVKPLLDQVHARLTQKENEQMIRGL